MSRASLFININPLYGRSVSRRHFTTATSLNTVIVLRVDVLFSDDLDSLEDEEVEGWWDLASVCLYVFGYILVYEVSPLDEESEDDVIDPLLFVQKYINSDDTLKR